MDPKISVIMPAYNAEKYVEESLASLERQTMKEFEVIIVNDGSKDKTKKIIRNFIKDKPRFTLLNVKNAGVSTARNIGLDKAKGEYICFLDADDLFFDDALEKLYEAAQTQQADLVIGDYVRFDAFHSWETKFIDKLLTNPNMVCTDTDILYSFYVWNKMYRRDKIEKLGLRFPVQSCFEDGVFTHRYFLACEHIVAIQDNICQYRRHLVKESQSITQRADERILNDCISSYQTILQNAKQTLTERKCDPQYLVVYMREVYKKKCISLFYMIYKYFWQLSEEMLHRVYMEVKDAKEHMTTADWYEIQKEFNELPPDSLPANAAEMRAFCQITIAVFHDLDAPIEPLVETLLSLYEGSFLKFRIVVPKYAYKKLPDSLKSRKNLIAIAEYGRNGFYNKALRTNKSRYMMFTQSGYYYHYALGFFYNRLKKSVCDFISTPVTYCDAQNNLSLYEFSRRAFDEQYGCYNFNGSTTDVYDCVLFNKLFSADYLRKIGLHFDGYEFSSAFEAMKNACFLRRESNVVLAFDPQLEEHLFGYVNVDHFRSLLDAPYKKITFAAVNGKKFTQNLSLLRDELARQNKNLDLNYCFANLTVPVEEEEEDDIAEPASDLLNDIADADVVISATDLPDTYISRTDVERKVMILPVGSKVKSGYTDIFCQSQENAQTLAAADARVIASGTPMVEYLLNLENRNAAKEMFYRSCPAAAGKELVVITSKLPAQQVFANVDLLDFQSKFEEQYYLYVNVPEFDEVLKRYDQNLSGFVFSMRNVLSYGEEVLIADVFVTTNRQQGIYFSAYNKPLFFINPPAQPVLPAAFVKRCSKLVIADLQDIPQLLAAADVKARRVQREELSSSLIGTPSEASATIAQALLAQPDAALIERTIVVQ